jgi:hypothetical protein
LMMFHMMIVSFYRPCPCNRTIYHHTVLTCYRYVITMVLQRHRSIVAICIICILCYFSYSDSLVIPFSIDIRSIRSKFVPFDRDSFILIYIRFFRSMFVHSDRYSFFSIDVRSFRSIFVQFDRCSIDIEYLERNVEERSEFCTYIGDNVSSTLIEVDQRDDVCSDDLSSYVFMLKKRHVSSFLSNDFENCSKLTLSIESLIAHVVVCPSGVVSQPR